MARGRFISESVAKDARLNSLSIEAELVYLMAIPHLDRDGLIEGNPDVLWGTVCPMRRQLIDRMASFIQEWTKAGLVLGYDTEEGVVLWFKGFYKNQIGLRYDRETPSRFPPPPGHERGKDGIIPTPPPHLPTDSQTFSSNSTEPLPPSADELRQSSGNVPATIPQPSGSCSAQYKDQVKDQERDPRVRASPLIPAFTHTRSEVTAAKSARLMNRDYTGIEPKLHTRLTNHVKQIYGFAALIDRPGDDSIEDKMRDEAYRLWKLGYNSDEDMLDLRDAWNEHAARLPDKRPYRDQLYEVAISLISHSQHSTPSVDFALEDVTP